MFSATHSPHTHIVTLIFLIYAKDKRDTYRNNYTIKVPDIQLTSYTTPMDGTQYTWLGKKLLMTFQRTLTNHISQ